MTKLKSTYPTLSIYCCVYTRATQVQLGTLKQRHEQSDSLDRFERAYPGGLFPKIGQRSRQSCVAAEAGKFTIKGTYINKKT